MLYHVYYETAVAFLTRPNNVAIKCFHYDRFSDEKPSCVVLLMIYTLQNGVAQGLVLRPLVPLDHLVLSRSFASQFDQATIKAAIQRFSRIACLFKLGK